MTPDDPTPDTLIRDYQRASAAEAGRPSDATRAAIMAEARAASLRRSPAANDSRYVWRAVAGIAVIGVALLLWRHAEPVATTAQIAVPAPSPPAESKAAQELQQEPQRRAVQAAEQPATVAKIPMQAVAKSERERSVVADAAARLDIQEKSAGGAAGAVVVPAAPAAAITAVPDARSADSENASLASRSAQSVRPIAPTEWILLDRDGTRLQQGTISPGETLESIRADLVKRYPGRGIGAWDVRSQTAAAQLQ